MKFSTALVILTVLVAGASAGLHRVCKDTPADIVFMIDESSSIWPVHFAQLRNFIGTLTERFTVSPNATRFSAITFSDKVKKRFGLSDYKNGEDVKKAVESIDQRRGGTKTHEALRYIRHKVVPNMRDGVPKIAILITDGVSWYPAKTAREASLLHRLNVTVFAVAVSNQINYKEIEVIATDPDEKHIFTVDSYDDLSETLVRQLVSSACSIRDTPGVCNLQLQTDVVFVAASAAQNPSGVPGALSLMESVVDDNNTFIGKESLQFGLVPTCQTDIGLDLKDFSFKAPLLSYLRRVKRTAVLQPADYINYMTDYSFTERAGDRKTVRNVAVIVMDTASPLPLQTVAAAEKAKAAGIEIIVVAVGKSVSDSEITGISSEPLASHKITLSNYLELDEFKQKFYSIICP